MCAWCAEAGVAGWLTMFGVWAVFVGLTLWAISRLIPAAPHATHSDQAEPIAHEPQPDTVPSVGPSAEEPSTPWMDAVGPRPR
jgi:hypothetical protein